MPLSQRPDGSWSDKSRTPVGLPWQKTKEAVMNYWIRFTVFMKEKGVVSEHIRFRF